MSAPESWKAAYRELIGTIVRMGYPEELGKAIRASDDFKAVSAGEFALAMGAVNGIQVHLVNPSSRWYGIFH